MARGSPGQARNLLGIAKTLFSWAARQKRFGLKASPCGDLKAKDLIGTKASTDRILNDTEVVAFWRNVDRLIPTDPRIQSIAAGRVGYPYGPLYKMLLLSGLRLNECADASWDEFDLKEKLWIIPKERMKGTNEKARAHTVPLTDDMLAILEQLPRFKGGDFLFSVTGGKKPVWASAKVKKKLDARMLRSLRALARMRRQGPRQGQARSVGEPRSAPDVAQRVVAAAHRPRRQGSGAGTRQAGMPGIYDRYELLDEKRDALELWSARVRRSSRRCRITW